MTYEIRERALQLAISANFRDDPECTVKAAGVFEGYLLGPVGPASALPEPAFKTCVTTDADGGQTSIAATASAYDAMHQGEGQFKSSDFVMIAPRDPFVPPLGTGPEGGDLPCAIEEAIAVHDENVALAREMFEEEPMGYGHTGFADDPDALTSAIKAIADEPPEGRDASLDPEAVDEDVLVLEDVVRDPGELVMLESTPSRETDSPFRDKFLRLFAGKAGY